MSKVSEKQPQSKVDHSSIIQGAPERVIYKGHDVTQLVTLLSEVSPQHWARLMEDSMENLVRQAETEGDAYAGISHDYQLLKYLKDAFAAVREVEADESAEVVENIKNVPMGTDLPGTEPQPHSQADETSQPYQPVTLPTYDMSHLETFVQELGPEAAENMMNEAIHWFYCWLQEDDGIDTKYTAKFLYYMEWLRNAFRDMRPGQKESLTWWKRV